MATIDFYKYRFGYCFYYFYPLEKMCLKMKNSYLSLLVILVSVISCSDPKEKDYSLPLEKYSELGMPDFSRPWKISEFADVIATLRDILNNEPLSLPRKGSSKSGELFEHLTSMDNLSFLENDSLPLYEKAYRIQSFVLIQDEYVDIYTDLYRREQYYNKELIDIYIFGISVSQKMLNLAYQINESDKPGDVGMQSGFQGIQYGHVFMISTCLGKQKNTSLYKAEDLERLSDSIALSVRRNMSWYDSTAVEQIKDNMLVAIDSSSSDQIRKKYRDILNKL